MRSLLAGPAAAICLLGLSACASAPPVENVLLSPPQSEQAVAQSSEWDVRRVQVPEYLDSYDIQLRTDDYVLTRLKDARWAERLPVAMTRLLQQTVNQKLVTRRDEPYQVDVRVDTFEPQPSNEVVLSARWRVTDTRTNDVVARDNSLIRQPLPASSGSDPAAIGRAMSGAVRQLGFRIVAAAG